MSSTASWRIFVRALSGAILAATSACVSQPPGEPILFADDFHGGLANWHIEAERGGHIAAHDGVLDIDVPAGLTLWFKPRLTGPLTIEFTATAVAAGGPNDAVSDLNVFWMASNPDGSAPFPLQRSGAFVDYNNLLTYYVGLGGNRNSTSRFRRYIGDPDIRPLLPEHDLGTRDALLVPNRRQTITLVAAGGHIEYRRDGRTLFTYEDPVPYVQGWFAIRTTYSHLRIERLRIHSAESARNSR